MTATHTEKKKKTNYSMKIANMNTYNDAAKEIFRHNSEVDQLKAQLKKMKKRLAEANKWKSSVC